MLSSPYFIIFNVKAHEFVVVAMKDCFVEAASGIKPLEECVGLRLKSTHSEAWPT